MHHAVFFDKFKIYFYNPFIPTEIGEYIALKKISHILSNNGFTLTDFGLPTCIENLEYEIYFNEMDVLATALADPLCQRQPASLSCAWRMR